MSISSRSEWEQEYVDKADELALEAWEKELDDIQEKYLEDWKAAYLEQMEEAWERVSDS